VNGDEVAVERGKEIQDDSKYFMMTIRFSYKKRHFL